MADISRRTFDKMEVDSKLGVLFDYMTDIIKNAPKRVEQRDMQCALKAEACNKRFNKVEKHVLRTKLVNTAASFTGGFIGGWSAVWASFKLSVFGN